MTVYALEGYTSLLVLLVMLGVKGFAFINAVLYPTEAYPASSRGTKAAWTIGLGLGLVAQILIPTPLTLINLAFTIAAFVYLADTRPALAEVTQRH
ncbi:hypothetical protein CF8_3331 [Nocardioides sp. CF8]|uniref:DUF2516 family protein n=1 Tax=Nocardioides sp. CF8 TaxID=110319 RepID=UPI00032E9A64|nr:DUF2516 family protein [Nocardioides sp. CF8]EON22741.1 hypothetical protein CF8_3331 [Nocardioides sp. CF8]